MPESLRALPAVPLVFSETVYYRVGGLLGFLAILSPVLALLGPFARLIPQGLSAAIGHAVLVTAGGILVGNTYLICRGFVIIGDSYCPLVTGVVAASGFTLLQHDGPLRWVQCLLGFSVLDLFVMPLVSLPVVFVVNRLLWTKHGREEFLRAQKASIEKGGSQRGDPSAG